MAGFTDRNLTVPGRGERVASFVESYLRLHPGLTPGELCVCLKADKRDLERLLRDRSVGHRLEDRLAEYFGQIFIDALFPPEHFGGRAVRERELLRELAEIEARNRRAERERAERRAAASRDGRGLGSRQDREAHLPQGDRP